MLLSKSTIKSIENKVLNEQEKTGQECKNFKTVLYSFALKGIPLKSIKPSVNVLTFKKWIDKGRVVSKGEHGVKICVVITDKKNKKKTFPKMTAVFHISQTSKLVDE